MNRSESISFSIPTDPAYLSLARMFGGSVAKTFGLDEEQTEDLRLTLSEVCASAVEGSPVENISVEVRWNAESLEFSCSPARIKPDEPRWMLIEALMPDMRLDAEEGTLIFRVPR